MSRKIRIAGIRREGTFSTLLRLMRSVGISGDDLLKTAHAVAVENGYTLLEVKFEAAQSGSVLQVQPMCNGSGPSGSQVKAYILKLQQRFLELGLTSEFSVGMIMKNTPTSCDDIVQGEVYLVSIQRKST